MHQIHALILENTFVSIPRLVPHVLPIVVPFMPLCTEVWDSGTAILKFKKDVGPNRLPGFPSMLIQRIATAPHALSLW